MYRKGIDSWDLAMLNGACGVEASPTWKETLHYAQSDARYKPVDDSEAKACPDDFRGSPKLSENLHSFLATIDVRPTVISYLYVFKRLFLSMTRL